MIAEVSSVNSPSLFLKATAISEPQNRSAKKNFSNYFFSICIFLSRFGAFYGVVKLTPLFCVAKNFALRCSEFSAVKRFT